jgi:uncharacterized protein
MTNMMELAVTNLTSPAILFFGLGLFISLIKAKVEFPGAASDFIILYLLTAIGFKGGATLAETGLNSILGSLLGALLLCVLIPVYSFYLLWRIGGLKIDDAAAIAGHYGSISVVTFMAASTFLINLQVGYEGYINGLPALMETPGIIMALFLASWTKQKNHGTTGAKEGTIGQVAKNVILSKSVVLLLGAMVAGYLSGPRGLEPVKVFYQDIFMGVLSLFMLEMGMAAASKLMDIKKQGLFMVLFGILTPIFNALLGIVTGLIIGLSVGGATLLGVLTASSSYIVAPAAMRTSLPKASPALYLGTSLGITLPFNLVIGIPLYYGIAVYFANLFK